MEQTKSHPEDAIARRCKVCGFVTEPLTDREWLAERPSHVLSVRHQDAVEKLGKSVEASVEPSVPNASRRRWI
jgi:hypothetical protein